MKYKLLLKCFAEITVLVLGAPTVQLPVVAQTYTVLHTFTGGVDGYFPYGQLTRDDAGNLYGTTGLGGDAYSGTLYKIDAAGNKTILHSLIPSEGYNPFAGLVRDDSGNLYGAGLVGGAYDEGTLFRLDEAGSLDVL